MTAIGAVCRLIVVCAAWLVMMCVPGYAQTKVAPAAIVVIDVQAAMQQALASKAIKAQRDQYLQGFQAELDGGRKSLKETENNLIRLKETLPAEQWQMKARAFEQQVFEFNQKFQRNTQAVEKSFRAAMGELSDALTQVSDEVAGELGANIVLPKSQIFLHDPRLEVTSLVIERLNRKLPNVVFPPPVLDGDAGAKTQPAIKKK